MSQPTQYQTFTATCHTKGCSNAEQPIKLEYDPEFLPDSVQCGVCGQIIEDNDAPKR
jgi:hypothetical protein